MTIASSNVDEQGRTTIPAEVCRLLGVGPGAVLAWEMNGGSIVVRRAGRYTSEDIRRALFEEPPEPRTLEELTRARRGREPVHS